MILVAFCISLESGGNAGSIETTGFIPRSLPYLIRWNLAETPARLKLLFLTETECEYYLSWNLAETPARLKLSKVLTIILIVSMLESGGNAGSIETHLSTGFIPRSLP